jgi:hypothetical protein
MRYWPPVYAFAVRQESGSGGSLNAFYVGVRMRSEPVTVHEQLALEVVYRFRTTGPLSFEATLFVRGSSGAPSIRNGSAEYQLA